MPVWHKKTQAARDSGELIVLGVIQEQHAERCQLYAQWQQFDWTIVHDPINQMRARAVPYFIAIDEAGVVVDANLRSSEYEAFLERPKPNEPPDATSPSRPNRASLLAATASESNGKTAVDAWLALAEHDLLWETNDSLPNRTSLAIESYDMAIAHAAESELAHLHFGKGVAERMRFDERPNIGDEFNPDTRDFQSAVDSWGRALELDPNHYIYRRRIQQYGPRLIKPYPFYDWVDQATREIEARGETAIKLRVMPSGAEIAQPSRKFSATESPEPPDPKGRIQRDLNEWIQIQSVVVPGSIQPGQAARIHVTLQPRQNAHWNNEADPVAVWIQSTERLDCSVPLHELSQAETPESSELRKLEFEVQANEVPEHQTTERSPDSVTEPSNSAASLRGYALYYVCEEQGGQCMYLRQDFEIPIAIQQAPRD